MVPFPPSDDTSRATWRVSDVEKEYVRVLFPLALAEIRFRKAKWCQQHSRGRGRGRGGERQRQSCRCCREPPRLLSLAASPEHPESYAEIQRISLIAPLIRRSFTATRGILITPLGEYEPRRIKIGRTRQRERERERERDCEGGWGSGGALQSLTNLMQRPFNVMLVIRENNSFRVAKLFMPRPACSLLNYSALHLTSDRRGFYNPRR